MIRSALALGCSAFVLTACSGDTELGRSLGLPPTIPVEQAAELYPDYAIDFDADQGIARFLSNNCSTLSLHASRDVSERFKLNERLATDGFSSDFLDALPDETRKEIMDKVNNRAQEKFRAFGMTSRSQSCSTGRQQIAQGTVLGSLLVDDRSGS